MKKIVKRLLSYFRQSTAAKRALPDFVIIGAQKAGTTSLYEQLKQHPALLSNVTVKEIHYFDRNWEKGENWYRANFPKRITGKLYYEATPYYLFHPHAPARCHNTIPNAKLIAILRNPIDRTYSGYQHQVRAGRESLSFVEALAQEPSRLSGEMDKMMQDEHYQSENNRFFSYMERSKYVEQIKRWLEYYPKDQILVVQSEQLWSNPDAVYDEIFRFLGVEPMKIETKKIHNIGSYSDKIPKELQDRLYDYFLPFNDELFDLIGKKFNWDKQPDELI